MLCEIEGCKTQEASVNERIIDSIHQCVTAEFQIQKPYLSRHGIFLCKNCMDEVVTSGRYIHILRHSGSAKLIHFIGNGYRKNLSESKLQEIFEEKL